MSVLADTCGWIEWLADGPLTDHYGPSLDYLAGLLVPTCLQFELYNWAKRGAR